MSSQKKNIGYIVFIAFIALIYIVYLSMNSPKERYTWDKTYTDGMTEPYDFGVYKSLLEKKAGSGFKLSSGSLIKTLSKQKASGPGTYHFIGRYCFLSRQEIDSLLEFAAIGNKVIMVAEGIPDTLIEVLNEFGKPFTIKSFHENTIQINSINPNSKLGDYRFTFRSYKNQMDAVTDWYYISKDKQISYYYDNQNDRYVPLNSINKKVNHAIFKVGNGEFYLHTSPMLFTNYALIEKNGFRYMEEIFNGVEFEEMIYDVGSREIKFESANITKQSDSPLSYILKQESLRWAWYLFLATVVLFFIFRAKRKQRLVPVLEKKRNTSLGFIETLSGLYFSRANHRKMAETKMHLFLYFIRHKLKISTHSVSKDTFRQIAQKTGVTELEVESLFDYYIKVVQNETSNMSADDLIRFHNRITHFYTLYKTKK